MSKTPTQSQPDENKAGSTSSYRSTASRRKKRADAAPLATGEFVRLGKDEMNLIEHPFAMLWQREPGDSVIFHEWDQVHPVTGKILRATWTVTGAKEYGLPTAGDERVYLVLMELSRESSFRERSVGFSRHEVVKRLGWSHNDRSYGMLEDAFNRLTGVTIYAKNAFWNPKRKTYSTGAFHMLEHFLIENESPGRIGESGKARVSFFAWSEFVFESFQNGYIRSIDLDFALSLSGDIALRLYRYLDKKAWDGRHKFEIDIFNLCIGHLGMKPNIYPSKLRERLKPAHEELIERGFLKSVSFEKTHQAERKSEQAERKSEKVIYAFARGEGALPASLEAGTQGDEAAPVQGTLLFGAPDDEPTGAFSSGVVLAIPGATQTVEPQQELQEEEPAPALSPEQEELLARMEAIRVSVPIARELLLKWPSSAIRCQLDCLEDRQPKNRAATFVKSVRELWALPDEYVKRIEAQEREEKRRSRFMGAAVEADTRAVESLGAALAGSDRPLVITSAVGVVHPRRVATEDDAGDPGSFAAPRLVSERAALSLASKGVRASVVRLPSSVHGDGDYAFIPRLINIARKKGVSAYVDEGLNLWPAVHRLDAVHLFRLALEKGVAGARYHGVAEEGIPFRDIAQVIGKRLNVPVVSKSPKEAAKHFGMMGMFVTMDVPATSTQTQQRLGWHPAQPGLIPDVDRASYFKT
jgi:nucleoside-diphosphate-sugar epimerase